MANSWNACLINCKTNLILTWFENCVIESSSNANQAATFAINDTELDVPVVTLSTQDYSKLLQQLKSGFKRTINWNKNQSKVTTQAQSKYFFRLFSWSKFSSGK